ncbi:MAG TPA: translation initiation factor [Polyangia bacterium]
MSDEKRLFNNPFAKLGDLRRDLPPGAEPAPAPPAAAARAPRPPARAAVRLERKGRGGKEATVVEHLGLSADEAERWLRELKQALGCGGTLEDAALVFQGDQRQRLAELLAARGVRKVSVG